VLSELLSLKTLNKTRGNKMKELEWLEENWKPVKVKYYTNKRVINETK